MLTIYKASAGSGKTYTLAYEYVRLLLGVKDEEGRYRLNLPGKGVAAAAARHRSIIAMTFTNKATEEMKSRIISELAALADDHADGSADSPYVAALSAEFGCRREQLRQAASQALRSLLFDYHHFNISTIDSFFQTVLRAFAREVDHQGDYGIELDDEYAVSAGIGMMLDDLNYGNPPKRKQIMRWIRDYTMELAESGKDSSMFNRSGSILRSLVAYVRKMGSEVFKKSAKDVLEYLAEPERMTDFVRAVDERIKAIGRPLGRRAEELLGRLTALGYEREALNRTIVGLMESVIEGRKVDIADRLGKVAVSNLLNWRDNPTDAIYVKKNIPGSGRNKTYPPTEFAEELCDWMRDCRDGLLSCHALEIIKQACPNLEFLGFTWHYIQRFREENNLILLSDTNDLIDRIINGSETPFIYERIGVMLQHFLIDEFQDTSLLQWKNLRPLVAGSVSDGNDNLIIGDEKQAIYRFRNSDSSLLHHGVMSEFDGKYSLRGNCAAENTNYRSAAGLVRFNNALFTRIAANCGVEGYENTVQSVAKTKKGLGSYIRIFDTSGLDDVNGMPAELDIVAREIVRQHEAGYRWADIAVLVRTRKEAELVVNYLLGNYPQVKVLSDEALLLRNSPAVKQIVSMLKLVDLSYSATADSLVSDNSGAPVFASAGDIRLIISRYQYYVSEGTDTVEALHKAIAPSSDTAGTNIAESIFDIRSAHPSGLVSLVETIIAKKLSPATRRKEYAYLAAFQDEVMKYCSLYNPSVHAFLSWWDEASGHLAISSGSGQDAVAVMTVHKAKGLQWACVHVPFGDWELERARDSIWIEPAGLCKDMPPCPPLLSVELDKTCLLEGCPMRAAATANRREQIIDNLNVTYVAYTRPERELTVCFSKHNAVGKEVFTALAQPAGTADPELCMDLAACMAGDNSEQPGLVFVAGEPTTPGTVRREDKTPDSNEAGDYRVFFRDDTAALTTIDDATADVGEIMDAADPNEESEERDVEKKPYSDTRMQQAAERGIHLHAILADIASADDIDEAVRRVALRYSVDGAVASDYRDIIASALEHAGEKAERWFAADARVLKERSIYLPESDATFRPDRIVIQSDGSVDVIDYKFTSEPLASHVRQVGLYVRLLKAMGYDRVEGYLWYPELNIIRKVSQTE